MGELVHFVASERGIEWQARAGELGRTMTGHHPDQGWFCGVHRPRARELAATLTIDEALFELRQGRH